MTPGSGRFPWRRKWQPAPAFLPGESHGQRSPVGYSPGGCKESDTTERLTHTRTHTHTHTFMYTLIHRHTMTEMQLDQNKLPARGGGGSRLSRKHAPHIGSTWERQVPGPHLHIENSARQEAEFPEHFSTRWFSSCPCSRRLSSRSLSGRRGRPPPYSISF